MRLVEFFKVTEEVHRFDYGVDIANVKVLFHATHVGNLEEIKAYGVVPMHGEIVKSTEAYQQMEEWGEELEEIAFFGPNDLGFVNWQVGNHIGKNMHDVTPEDIRKYGVVTILFPWRHKDEIYCSDGEGGAMSLGGEKLYDVPAHVEGPDCFSYEPVEPDKILVGDELIAFIEKYYPSILVWASGGKDWYKARQQDPGYVPEKSPEDAELYDAEGNMHDDANRADWNNPGTFGMGMTNFSKSFSFSPEEHPGILLPGEADPEGSDDIEDRMVVVKKT